jgi:kynurenine formamidase
MVFHGPNVTHLDALSHTVFDRRLYNGASVDTVTPERGADVHAVTVASEGIVTRGVLVDAAGAGSWLAPGTAVRAAHLDELLAQSGAEVGPGDAVLLRTGYGLQRRVDGPQPIAPRAGWHPDCLPWFRDHDVSVIGSDGYNEALPNPYEHLRMPVHIVGQVGLGLWLLDNLDLESAADHARVEGRWAFQLVVAPLRVPGGTGSPVNPIAVF